MKIETLFEYMDPSSLTADVWNKLPKLITDWAKEELPYYLKTLIPEESKNVETIGKARQAAYKENDWKIADKLGDRYSNVTSDARDEFEKAFDTIKEPISEILRYRMETTLQDIARDYFETKYGKIEPPKREGFDFKGNLYWLQHILVHIVTDAKIESGKQKGESQTRGGYFQSWPSKKEFQKNTTAKTIDWKNELAQGIVIYASPEQLTNVAKSAMLDELENEWYGESYGERHNVIPNFIKHIIDVFVHEVNHMYQATTRSLAGPGRGQWSLGLIPDPEKTVVDRKASEMQKKGRGSDKLNKGDPAYRKFKAGKRGHPTRSPRNKDNEHSWSEYLGTMDEIDSHAIGTAADIVSEYYSELKTNGRGFNFNQKNLNYTIDNFIEDIKYGSLSSSSFDSYKRFVRDKIKKMDDALPASALPKIDILHRKVWRLYVSRLIRYLQTYKKPIEKSDWDYDEKPRPKLP